MAVNPNMKAWFLTNLALIVKSLKKVEDNLDKKYDKINQDVFDRLSKIVDGKDGKDGRDGKDGKQGERGEKVAGRDGKDGRDGDSVVDAKIDFDGSLVITMSTGKEINVGEVVPEDLKEKLRIFVGSAAGPAGAQGAQGIQGLPGIDGNDGQDGASIPGPKGDAGPAGANGTIGRDGLGVPGMDGMDGEDAMMIPGQRGADGTAGAAGATGATGAAGIGIPGIDGEDGESSMPIPGPRGANGTNGTNGTNGRDGITVVMEPELPDDPIVIPGPAGASGGAVPAANSVTRAMLLSTSVTGGKNWVFLGQGTASAATSTGTITWAGQFKQLMVEYFIAGYAGNGIGRILVANSGTPSPTATTCCTSIIVGVTAAPTTPVSNSGWPTAIATGLVPRYGWLHVSNINGVLKRATGHGQYGGTAPTTVPTQVRIAGMSSQTTLIQTLVMTSYTLATGNVIGGTMNAGTFVNVWGRNDD